MGSYIAVEGESITRARVGVAFSLNKRFPKPHTPVFIKLGNKHRRTQGVLGPAQLQISQ